VNGSTGQRPTLHGFPVFYTEAAQAVGAEGDLVLLEPRSILTATREEPVRQDVSLDVWFDQGQGALRFTMRFGAVPWLGAPLTRPRTSTTVSTIVTLEAR
jgi:HK97 family phage major capsid protein